MVEGVVADTIATVLAACAAFGWDCSLAGQMAEVEGVERQVCVKAGEETAGVREFVLMRLVVDVRAVLVLRAERKFFVMWELLLLLLF